MVALGMVLWRILLNGDAPPSEVREEIVEAADPERRPIPPPTAVQVPEKAEPEAEPRPEAAAASAESAPAPAPQTSESEPATAAQAAARSATAAVPVRRELVFTFEEDSWLDVRDGEGRRLAYELGRRGTRRTITGQAPFEIFLGNWPGVTVTFDGGQVPVPEAARRGKTARFSVPGGAE
jgi:cytoskeleton protein RodZ